MYTDADLADLRAMSLDAMDAVAEVRRPVSGPQPGYGHPSRASAAVASGVPCRVVPRGTGTETVTGSSTVAEAPWLVQMDGAWPVEEHDVITVTWPKTGDVVTYAVVSADTPRSYQINTRAACTLAS